MSLEKPWEKEFDILLDAMQSQWGGTVKKSENTDFWMYPTFRTEVDSYPTHIEVSEFPVSGLSAVEAADNVEYLRIYLRTSSDYEFFVRQEDSLDWLKKKLGFLVEHQTGANDFDDRYVLFVRGDNDRDFLGQAEGQAAIDGLAPFTAMRVWEHGIQWSQWLRDESQLEFLSVNVVMGNLIQLAKTVRRQ